MFLGGGEYRDIRLLGILCKDKSVSEICPLLQDRQPICQFAFPYLLLIKVPAEGEAPSH